MRWIALLLGLVLAGCGSAPDEGGDAKASCNVEEMSYTEVDEFLDDDTHLTACSRDDECVVFTAICGARGVAHREDAECLAAAHAKLGHVIDCIPPEEAPFRPACVENTCVKLPAE